MHGSAHDKARLRVRALSLAFLLSLSVLAWCLTLLPVAPALASSGRLVRVGYDPSYGNIELGPNGRPTGYGHEYLMQVAQYADWQYQFVACDWAQCLTLLEEGEVDIVPTMQRTAARERLFDFSADKQGYEYATLLTRADNADVYYDDAEGLHGLRVGMVRNNAINDDFESYAAEHRLRLERHYFQSVEEILQALHTGKVDVIVGSSTMRGSELKVVAHLGVRAFYMGVGRKSRGVLDILNDAQRRMNAQDIYFTARLHEKYFLLSHMPVGLSRKEADFIRQSAPLRVAVNASWWPLESYPDKDSPPKGILSDTLADISRRLGVRFQYLRTESYEESLRIMRNGEADIIAGLSGTLEKTLPGVVVLSRPLLRMPLVLVGLEGESVPGDSLRVAVPRLFMGSESVRSALPPESRIYYENVEDVAAAVRKGETPLALLSAWRFDRTVREPGYRALRVVRLLPTDADVVLGVSTHVAPELLAILNKGVMALDRQFLDMSILRHTISEPAGVQWLLLWRTYSHWLLPGLLSLCLVVLCAALFQRNHANRQLRRVALSDEVTGMGNLKAFMQRGSLLIKGEEYVLVSMDINNFKNYNAYHGYQAGNAVLCSVARELWFFLQDKELACRTGGDEFSLLLRWPDEGGLHRVQERLNNWRESLAVLDAPLGQQNLKLSFSFGLYHLAQRTEDLTEALARAGFARKSAKENYKTTFGVYDEAMHKKVCDERLFEQEMLGAQARGEFSVRVQPKYDVHGLNVVGGEALVRWEHPTRGEIMPSAFVNLFERNGFIAKLDMYVLDFVCRLLRRWSDEGRALLPISVNMSRLHVLDYNFAQSVREVIDLHGVDPKFIELEISEAAFLENADVLPEILDRLKATGVRLAMDNFGTGYFSLSMLKNTPLQVLKLDKAFLQRADQERSRGIVRHVLALAHDLHLDVVCEGVETGEHVDFLRTTHCKVGQGFHFARPMSAAQFERLVFGDVPDVVVDVPRHHSSDER